MMLYNCIFTCLAKVIFILRPKKLANKVSIGHYRIFPSLNSKTGFIFQSEPWSILGTPTEERWPGVTSLRDWHSYPHWEPQDLAQAVPSLGSDGIDLLSVSVCFQLIDFCTCDFISLLETRYYILTFVEKKPVMLTILFNIVHKLTDPW